MVASHNMVRSKDGKVTPMGGRMLTAREKRRGNVRTTVSWCEAGGTHGKDRYEQVHGGGALVSADTCHGILFCVIALVAVLWLAGLA